MKTYVVLGSVLLVASGAATAADVAPPADNVAAALSGGQAHLSFRLRYEDVDDAAFASSAAAVTLRSRVSWQSAAYQGLRAVVEIDDLRALVDDYNSTTNGKTTRPIVADPRGTDINRAALEWTLGATQVAVGRQRVVLDNQRFVGNSGWRQNEQTFDGITLRSKAVAKLELSYAYLYNVNRVYGPDNGAQAAEWHGRVHLFNVRLDAGRAGTLTAFAYLMDFHNAATNSNATTGVLWSGSAAVAPGWSVPYSASYARQTDYADNPIPYSTHYWQLETGVAHGGTTVKIGREVLGGDAAASGHRFQTPLATLHLYQGWDDKFLVTPPKGIEDTYLGVTQRVRAATLQASWHDFHAAAASQTYGHEWNASLAMPFCGRYEALLKAADYRARGFGTDSRKLWLMVSANF